MTSEHLGAMAAEFGTPLYVYDASLMRERYKSLAEACGEYPHAIHYAIKANATLAIVRLMRECGARADANSGGEMEVALRAGFKPEEIVFTGVGKSAAELQRAVTLGVKAINAESPGEVERIAAIARNAGTVARVAIRINPDVDAESHPHISTGLRTNKFGMSIDAARALAREIGKHASLHIVGLHVHIGSQITKASPLARAVTAMAGLAKELMADGARLEHLDVGGGLGIPYRTGETVVSPREYIDAILPPIRDTGLTLVLEPGRWIVGPAGALLTRVVDLKEQPADLPTTGEKRWFVIADAGMTDLLRPALYGAYHEIAAVNPRPGADRLCDIVGPVCETTDTLGSARRLPPVEVGDLLIVKDAGAYGSVMSSNYNRRPIPAEVLVDRPSPSGTLAQEGGRLIRRRQTIDDLLQWDS